MSSGRFDNKVWMDIPWDGQSDDLEAKPDDALFIIGYIGSDSRHSNGCIAITPNRYQLDQHAKHSVPLPESALVHWNKELNCDLIKQIDI